MSYYQNQPGQHPYQPVYVQAPPRGKSVASMVLGLVSIFFGWTFIAPLIGLILGFAGLKSEPAGRGMAITGVILNGIMILGWVLLIVIMVTVVGAASISGGME
ncbi:hypothetical protein GCM10027403_06900 [Arthrobacter tecti]